MSNGSIALQNVKSLRNVKTLRKDAWWVEPLITFAVLFAFIVYATFRAFENNYYYVAPYLSPFFSPCLVDTCAHVSWSLFGRMWLITPAMLILWIPGGFRLTCYYYRKAYYRSWWLSPPACAVRDGHKTYTGETRFPLLIQNIHRYFFYLATVILLFLWWDAFEAIHFPDGYGVGVGTVVLTLNATLLSLYSLSCHSCRHLCGGHLDSFSKHPGQYGVWKTLTKLNERHMLFAWISLIWVALSDVYVRLLATGVIHDIRIF
ncbi:MAG TPA: hypothetical protein VGH50_15600 [Candidatus Binatia bacterium]